MKIFFLVAVAIAGIYGAATVNRRILFVQTVPAGDRPRRGAPRPLRPTSRPSADSRSSIGAAAGDAGPAWRRRCQSVEPAIAAPTSAPRTRPRTNVGGPLIVAGHGFGRLVRRSSSGSRAAHGPAFRRVGPRIATIETNAIPIQATTDAETSRKSPIRRTSTPSRAPSASPAHAPRTAAISSSGSWPPAEPRMRT